MTREQCRAFCGAAGGYECKAGPFGWCTVGQVVHGGAVQRTEGPPQESAQELPRSWQPPEIARDLRMAERQGAHAEGARAAGAGLSRDVNPHAEGTALWLSWNAGWKGGAR